MNNHVAQVVKENPHATTHFITLIISMNDRHRLAIIRFAQELVMYCAPTRPSYLKRMPSIW